MKKKNKATYPLLILVLALWGFIIYRYIGNGGSSDSDDFNYQEEVILSDASYVIKSDTFELIASYRDPFLGKSKMNKESSRLLPSSSRNNSNITAPRVKPIKITEAIIPWPKIEYKGIVQSNASGKKIIILVIDSREYLTKEGDELQGISIQKIFKDSIFTSREKEVKTFLRLN